ncbi:MAG: hypothetical protein HKP14_04180, partial [Bacteroidia bacterium]|nr:hypothetical protein [Bacteroidia bacterium]
MKKHVLLIVVVGLFLFSTKTNAQNCTVNADIDRTYCENEDIAFKGSSAGLFETPNDLKWTQTAGPSVLISDASDPESSIIGYSGGNTYTFRLSATCEDGVPAFQEITYTVTPITQAQAGPDQTSCPGTGTLSANSPGTNESGSWSIAGNDAGVTIDSETSPTSTFSTSASAGGVSTLIWTIIGTNGCSSTDTVKITNYGGVSPVAITPNNANLSQCYLSTTAYPLNATFGGVGFQGQIGTWSQISGPSNVTFSDVNSNTATAGNLIEGTYKLKWTVNGPCASGSDEITIVVPKGTDVISPAIAPSIAICDGSTQVQLNGSASSRSNEYVRWRVVSGPGTILDTTSSNTTITGLNTSTSTTLSYSISNDSIQCYSSANMTISFPDTPSISPISNLVLACDAKTVDVSYTSNGAIFTRTMVSAPDDYTTETGNAVPGIAVQDGSPLNIVELLVPGTYVFDVKKVFSSSDVGCADAQTQFSVTTSIGPQGVNAGTDQLLICGVDTTFMAGNDPDQAGVIGTWSQISGPTTLTFTEPHNRNSKVENLNGGPYVCRWTLSGGLGCDPIQDDVILRHFNGPPTGIEAGPSRTVCYGNPINLAADSLRPGETGKWTVTPSTGITFADDTQPNTSVDGMVASTAYTYTWTVTNSCGSTPDNVTITTNNTLGPIASDAGPNQCLASGTTSITLAANNPGTFTGLWTKVSGPSATITSSSDEGTTVTGLSDGSYEFEWKISNGTCDPNVDTVLVTISSAASLADAGSDVDSCSNSITLAATALTVGEGTWSQFLGPGGWEVDDINSPTARFTSLVSGTYKFEWNVTNGACEGTSDTVRFSIDNIPSIPTADSSWMFCDGTTTIDLYGNEIENGYAIWSNLGNPPTTPSITDATADTTTATGLVSGIYSFERTAYSEYGICPSFKDTLNNVTIQVPADLGSDIEICELESSVQILGNDNTVGTWSQVSGSSVDTTTPTPNSIIVSNYAGGSSYEFEYVIPAVNGCPISRDTVMLTISDSVGPPNAGLDREFCDTSSFTLIATTTSSGAVHSWDKIFGPTAGTITDPDSATTTVTAIGTGLYIFQYQGTNGACTLNDIVRFENYATPTPTLAGLDQNICPEFTELEGNTITSGVGKWTQIGTTPSVATIEEEVNPTSRISDLTAIGTYSFEWSSITDSICPIERDTIDVVITHLNPTTALAGSDISSCDDNTLNLNGNAITLGSGEWTQIGTTPSVATIGSSSSPNTGVTLGSEGTYLFEWESTNGGCTTADTVAVVLNDSVVQPSAGIDSTICIEDNLYLYASNTGTQYFAWSQISGPSTVGFVDSNSYTTGVYNHQDGTYSFKLNVSNGVCPSKSDTVEITIDENCYINLSGRLYHDVNGLRDNPTGSVNGVQFDNPDNEQMYVSLIVGGTVYATTPIADDGTYNFLDIENYLTYDIVIHRTPAGSTTADLPTNWVHTGENQGLGANGDGTNNGAITSITANDADEIEINFGIQKRPDSDSLIVASQENPGGTTLVSVTDSYFGGDDASMSLDPAVDSIRITSFPDNVTSITINGTSYTSGSWPAGGVRIPTDADGVPNWAISIDPIDGSDTATIEYVTIDSAGYEDLSPGYVKMPFTLSLSGKVHNDYSGLTDNTINDGDGIDDPDGTQLYANLVDAGTGNIVATTPIASDGTYKFEGLTENSSLEVIIDTLAQTVGNTAVAGGLPTNWVHTGDTIGTNTGTDGTADGRLSVSLGIVNQPNVNYGIQKRPESDTITIAAVPNPGGSVLVTVADTLFGGDDLSAGVDAPIDSIRITAFPENVESIVIDGTSYTSGTWPAGGVTIPSDTNGRPDWTIQIDPINGQHVSKIDYVTIDSAGYEDLTDGYVRMPFTLKLSGKVHHDYSGLTDNTINDGDGIDDPDGVQLYAYLLDAATDTVIKSVAIAADGTYEFDDLIENTTYEVLIDTVVRTTGSTASGAGELPENWVHTGDTIGVNTGTDGVNDGRLTVALGEVDQPNVNFGIQKRPESDTITIAAVPNPGGSVLVTVADTLFGGDDLSAGVDAPIDSIRITAFPENVESIVIDGTSYTSGTWPTGGVTIPSDTNGRPDWTIQI